MHPHHSSTIEALESRIAPAGVVAITYDAITGVLGLAGDADANSISITKTGANTHRIEGTGGTTLTINGDAAAVPEIADIGKIISLTFNGAAGADTLSVVGLKTLNTLTVNGEAGDDSLSVEDVVVKGAAIFDFGTDGGELTLRGDDVFGVDLTVNYGANGGEVLAEQGSTLVVKGAVVLNGGAGADQFTLQATSAVLTKGVKFTAGEGVNELNLASTIATVGKSVTGKSVQFDGGGAADKLKIGGARVAFLGSIEFNAGAGANSVEATSAAVRVDGSLIVNGGANADAFSWASANTNIKGAVTLALGNGDNTAIFSGASVVLGSLLTVSGGAGADTLNLGAASSTDSVTVKGAVDVTPGNGSNKVVAEGAVLSLGAGFKFAGGTDDDDVEILNVISGVKGNLDVTLGDGVSTFFVLGSQATFGANVLVTSGDGGGILNFTANKLKAAGTVTVTTGAGDDSLEIVGALIDFKKTLAITTGDGGDIVNISGDGSVKGDVTVDLGAASAGSQFLDLAGRSGVAGNLKLGGKLTIFAATAAGLGNEDHVTITNVYVAKAMKVSLSEVDSFLTIDNLQALDTVLIETGAGEDTVEIEQNGFFGPSIFTKAVTIDLGDDADSILIGLSSVAGSSSFGRFLGGLAVTGGAGGDTSNDFLDAGINFFKTGTTNTSDI